MFAEEGGQRSGVDVISRRRSDARNLELRFLARLRNSGTPRMGSGWLATYIEITFLKY
jgi:hypothetical protein